ncbi:MAG: hypothetical protein NTX53_19530 [candidate division WOR-3 bacterium]|nr:hypothetical protein [candidate division WOR-3 bacterium]
MNSSSRHRLCAASLLVCLCIATGMCQYVEDSVDVGGAWVGSLAYSSEQDEIWGASWSGNCVFAISCSSNTVVASIPLSSAGDLVYDSTDGKLYCAYYGPGQESLAVTSVAARQVIKRLEMPGATTPVWDAVSDRVYVSCQTTNKVAVVDCATDSLLKYIPVGACPMKMYINTLRRKLYVLNYDAGTVSIVDMTTNQVIKTVDVGDTPNAGYYCRSADKFYSDGQIGQCVVIGGQSDTIVARIAVPGTQYVLSVTGNEQAGIVFAGMFAGNSGYIVAIDAEADSVTYTHDLGHALAEGLLYSIESGYLYSTGYPKSFCVLTGDGSRVIKTIPLGDAPFVIASAPAHRRLYVGNLNTSFVYVLRDVAGVEEPRSPRPEFCGALSVAPNPFTRSVTIAWSSLGKGGDVARAYAQDGRLVRQAQIPAGETRWVWDGQDSGGHPVPQGVYMAEVGGRRCKLVKTR